MTTTTQPVMVEETERQKEIQADVERIDAELRELAAQRTAIREEAKQAVQEPFRRFREVDDEIRGLRDRRDTLRTEYEKYTTRRRIQVGDVVVDDCNEYDVIDEWRGHFAIQPRREPRGGEDVLIADPEDIARGSLWLQGTELNWQAICGETICVEEDRSREDLMPI